MKQRYDLIATQRFPMLQDNDDDPARRRPDRISGYRIPAQDGSKARARISWRTL